MLYIMLVYTMALLWGVGFVNKIEIWRIYYKTNVCSLSSRFFMLLYSYRARSLLMVIYICNAIYIYYLAIYVIQQRVNMWPNTTKGTSCRPSLFWDNGQNSVQNIKKIKGNIDFVNVVFPKISLQLFFQIWYHWKVC